MDDLAAQFQSEQTDFDQLATRHKALTLNRWVRARNLTGLRDPDRDYRNLRNCLIGQALRHEDHESIPVTSSAIFSAIAQRIGINAHCCAGLGHVYVVVLSNQGMTLDAIPSEHRPGTTAQGDPPVDMMYLDPYGGDEEILAADLRNAYLRFGVGLNNIEYFLQPTPSTAIAFRTAQNIRATRFRTRNRGDEEPDDVLTRLTHGQNGANMEACAYGAMWASLLFGTREDILEWSHNLETLVGEHIIPHFPEDVCMALHYMEAAVGQFSTANRILGERTINSLGKLRELLLADQIGPQRRLREGAAWPAIPFKVGQIVRHKRYGWLGVIHGWSIEPEREWHRHATTVGNGFQQPPELLEEGRVYFECL